VKSALEDSPEMSWAWCERGDSNPHGLPRQILSLVRLPIPPLSRKSRLIVTELAKSKTRRGRYRLLLIASRAEPASFRLGPMNCILIVDDNAVIRRSLRGIFENEGWEVCGEAGNGREAIAKAQELHPDLVVLDVSMPIMNGMEAAPELRRVLPHTPIVLFSVHADAIPEADVAAAGITAVVPKADNMRSLIKIVRTLMQAA
jgi:CheY-like chemotaxis protein